MAKCGQRNPHPQLQFSHELADRGIFDLDASMLLLPFAKA